MPDEKVEQLKGLSLTADGKGAVFDVPAADVDLFIAGISWNLEVMILICSNAIFYCVFTDCHLEAGELDSHFLV